MLIGIKYENGCLKRNIGCRLGSIEIAKCLNEKFIFPEIDKNNCENALKQIEVLKGKIFVGGDHSVSYSLVKGFSKRFKNFGLVIFDAHPDCCEPFKTVTHEDWLRKLIQEKIIKKENVLLFGIRDIDKTEVEFLKGMNIIKCEEILNDKEIALKQFFDFIVKFKNVYLSLDIDIIDPMDAPGTGCKVKKGLKREMFLEIIKKISKFKSIKRIDLVEVNPKLDVNGKTIKLGCEVIKLLK